MSDFNTAEISAYYSVRVPGMSQKGREWRAACPVHRGKDLNFSVNGLTGMANCHSQCGQGWDIIGLEMALTSAPFARAKESVYKIVGRPEVPHEEREIEALYDYTDENGQLLYQVVRKFGKKFRQRQPRAGGWLWSLGDARIVPFQLPKVLASDFVAVTEGEKDALALTRIDIVATCNNGGAGHFGSNLAQYFVGKRIAVFADNDDPGRRHAIAVASILTHVAKSVRIVELPGLPQKGDVSDFIAKHGEAAHARILERYQAAADWTPDWQFATEIPDEDAKFVRTYRQSVADSGSLDAFWDFTSQEGRKTPFQKLTEALGGGMRDGEVYVIGGNQGSGKTSLALQFALTAVLDHTPVLMFSMEMHWRDVFQRLTAIHARVDLMKFRDLQKDEKDARIIGNREPLRQIRREIQEATNDLIDLELFVSNRTRVTPDYLMKESLRIGKRHKIGLILVDHMQLMGGTGNERTEYEKFTAISRALKETAMEIKIPVVLVSQTSRSNSAEKRTELNVSDLRGSGAIEEDAAAVMLLYPDAEHRKELLTTGHDQFAKGPVRSWLKLGKNRYGVQDVYLQLMHFKSFTRFQYGHDYVPMEETA